MFTLQDMQTLRASQPFVPFRLHLSDGRFVDVLSRELVMVGKCFAVVGILDPKTRDTAIDRYFTVWYLHVMRHEMLVPGAPPLPLSEGPAGSPSPPA